MCLGMHVQARTVHLKVNLRLCDLVCLLDLQFVTPTYRIKTVRVVCGAYTRRYRNHGGQCYERSSLSSKPTFTADVLQLTSILDSKILFKRRC